MNTITVSATKARNSFFELLNQVILGTEVIVKRDNREVAVIAPKKVKTDWKVLLKASKKVRGLLKDYDPEDNPLRRKGAAEFLGQWDKGLRLKRK